MFERVTGVDANQPEQTSTGSKWNVTEIENILEEIGQEHVKFTDQAKGISQGDFGRVRFEVNGNTLYLTFPTSEVAHVAFNTLSDALSNPYEFSSRFDQMPNTVMVQFTDSGIDESMLSYAHVDNAEPNRDQYELGVESDINEDLAPENIAMPTNTHIRKQVQDLKVGDILMGSGAKIISAPSIGINTPDGKAEVGVEYPNGKKKLQLWGKYTVVGLKREASPNEMPPSSLDTNPLI